MKRYKKTLTLSLFFLWGLGGLLAQTSTENYIQTKTYTKSDASATITTIQYFDGLGRPVETVQRGITPGGNDLVTYTEYDDVGREWKQWLPAPTVTGNNGAFVNIDNFKNNISTQYGATEKDYSFAETVYEQSPLNRIKEQFGAGNAWKTANKRAIIDYETNASEVKYFFTDGTNQLIGQGMYAPNTLYETTTKDEDGKQAIEYKDKLGRVVMQRNGNSNFADTYYAYNDLGQLCYVIPPLAADILGSGTYSETTDAIKLYGYVYKYDDRGNCIYKKLPGCDPIWMIYDKADRLIMSLDGIQRMAKNDKYRCTVTKYDMLGRIIFTGINEVTSTSTLDGLVTTYKNSLIVESYTNGVYSNNYFSNSTPLTLNFYDNYTFLPSGSSLLYIEKQGYGTAYAPTSGGWGAGAKGFLTGTYTYMLDAPNKYLISAMYYDDKGRMVQSRTKNYLGTYDYTYNTYNFIGQVTATYIDHTGNFPEEYTYSYDNAGRPFETFHKYSSLPPVKLFSNTYNELGQLTGKLRHNSTDTESFQYNIRGWLKKITSGSFTENLYYTDLVTSIGQQCYNGNISNATWTYNGALKGYCYLYDEQNRLDKAYEISSGGNNEFFGYDKMGNINSLKRYASVGEIDNLAFNYNGNQITSIYDSKASQNSYSIKEYQDIGGNATNEMGYDKNGNLTKDIDRKIVAIKYNLLNLPDTVQFSSGNVIINHYSAGGQKLRSDYYTRLTAITPLGENVVLNPEKGYSDVLYSHTGTAYVGDMEYSISKGKTQYYDGSWIYYDTYTPSKIYTPEGFIDNLNTSASAILNFGVRYNYFRKDHLGNTREVWNGARKSFTGVLKEVAATRQRMQYYPSGLPWSENLGTSVQNRKYNDKEFIEAHGLDEYDSEARWYYPAIMRTTTLDPLSEKYYSISPYAWCRNNPVNRIDPTGMEDEEKNNSSTTIRYRYKYVDKGIQQISETVTVTITTYSEDKSEKTVETRTTTTTTTIKEIDGDLNPDISTNQTTNITENKYVKVKENPDTGYAEHWNITSSKKNGATIKIDNISQDFVKQNMPRLNAWTQALTNYIADHGRGSTLYNGSLPLNNAVTYTGLLTGTASTLLRIKMWKGFGAVGLGYSAGNVLRKTNIMNIKGRSFMLQEVINGKVSYTYK